MPAYNRFTIVGTRFTRVFLDEAPLSTPLHDRVNDAFTAQLEIERINPSISYSDYRERKVMELGVSISADITWESEKGSKEPRKERAFEVRFVCGFIGKDKKYDGDLEALAQVQDELMRLVYLSKRDQVAALLEDTWFGTFALPTDLDFSAEVDKNASKKAAKKTPRKRTQGSS